MDRKRVVIKQEAIDEIFETSTEQGEYIIRLMKLAIPNFDNLESVDPTDVKITRNTTHYICQKCIDWDYLHEVASMKGGAWLNYGFSNTRCPDDLPDFVVDVPANYVKEI